MTNVGKIRSKQKPTTSGRCFVWIWKILKTGFRNSQRGIINCADCGSKMTPSYSNKIKKGKFKKRYYYYRCTSTLRNDWKFCDTKQVNADRLDRYVLDNLERISGDNEYIKNLVFRINHSESSGRRSGLELNKETSQLSAEKVVSGLKEICEKIEKSDGIAKNLLVKRFFKEIFYSKENIKITLFLPENKVKSGFEHTPRQGARSAQNFETEKAVFNPSFPKNEFVLSNSAAGPGFESR